MKAACWIVALCSVSAAAAIALVGPDARLAILAGMAGPAVAVCASWIAIERAFRRDPSRVTGLMMTGFVAKMLGFALFVVIALKGLALPARPFAVSFACYFVVLYCTEALLLKRLSAPAPRAATSH